MCGNVAFWPFVPRVPAHFSALCPPLPTHTHTFPAHFSAPPTRRRALCSTKRPCGSGADWCFQCRDQSASSGARRTSSRIRTPSAANTSRSASGSATSSTRYLFHRGQCVVLLQGADRHHRHTYAPLNNYSYAGCQVFRREVRSKCQNGTHRHDCRGSQAGAPEVDIECIVGYKAVDRDNYRGNQSHHGQVVIEVEGLRCLGRFFVFFTVVFW